MCASCLPVEACDKAGPLFMTIIEHIPLHLQPQPNPGIFPEGRRCSDCECFLSRNNPRSLCAPCQLASMPVCEVLSLTPEDEVA